MDRKQTSDRWQSTALNISEAADMDSALSVVAATHHRRTQYRGGIQTHGLNDPRSLPHSYAHPRDMLNSLMITVAA